MIHLKGKIKQSQHLNRFLPLALNSRRWVTSKKFGLPFPAEYNPPELDFNFSNEIRPKVQLQTLLTLRPGCVEDTEKRPAPLLAPHFSTAVVGEAALSVHVFK